MRTNYSNNCSDPDLDKGSGSFYFSYKNNHRHGFTLIEIMITIIVVGVIASLALPRFGFSMERNRLGEAISILSAIRQAQVVYEFENGAYTNTINDLDLAIPAPAHYDNIQLDTSDPIATIDRSQVTQNTYDYMMGIDANGDLCCTSTTPANICATLGYPNAC